MSSSPEGKVKDSDLGGALCYGPDHNAHSSCREWSGLTSSAVPTTGPRRVVPSPGGVLEPLLESGAGGEH